MRSPALRGFLKNISRANRDFTQLLFINEQFHLDYANDKQVAKEQFTSQFFTENKYSHRFNDRLVNLDEERIESEKFVLGSSFVFAYTTFDLYAEELLAVIQVMTQSDYKKPKNEAYLNGCFSALGTDLETATSREVCHSADYLRLRRNAIIHSMGEAGESLKTTIRYQGRSLNEYWKKELLQLDYLDFSINDVRTWSHEALVDSIRVFRRLAEKIDSSVLELLGVARVVRFLEAEFVRAGNSAGSKTREKLEKKFAGYTSQMYNVKTADIDFGSLTFERT